MGARRRVRMREEPGTHLDVPAEFFFPDSGDVETGGGVAGAG
jgi:hypothetical protein